MKTCAPFRGGFRGGNAVLPCPAGLVWFGLGSAIEAFLSAPGTDRKSQLALLQRMDKQWPFFKILLSNTDMVLAKSDLAIAARYVALVKDKRLGKKIMAAIKTEWDLTNQALNLITGAKTRLATQPALASFLAYRFPYVDPLNHLQIELMRRYRQAPDNRASEVEGETVAERVQRGIHLSINGVAAGLRNTG